MDTETNGRYFGGMGRIAGVTTEEIERRLIGAAALVFARRGYDGAGIAEITSEAGLSSGAVYSRFGSKAELFAANSICFLNSFENGHAVAMTFLKYLPSVFDLLSINHKPLICNHHQRRGCSCKRPQLRFAEYSIANHHFPSVLHQLAQAESLSGTG